MRSGSSVYFALYKQVNYFNGEDNLLRHVAFDTQFRDRHGKRSIVVGGETPKAPASKWSVGGHFKLGLTICMHICL